MSIPRILLLLTLVGLSALAPAFRSVARAQTPAPALPEPRALALPRATFPSGATLTGGPAGNPLADRSSRLHTVPFAQLHRTGGYLQTAQWMARGRLITLRYEAGIFPTPDEAGAAYADAAATLWEAGYPRHLQGIYRPAFVMAERDGHTSVVALLRQGPIESELTLRYAPHTDRQSIDSALWYLRRAAHAAYGVTHRAAGDLPPAQSNEEPQIYVAPQGTGPIVKSPSLMVLDTSIVPPDATLEPGAFRAASPPLAGRAVKNASLAPAGALARYTRTAMEGGGAWYDAAALFGSAQQASDAFTALQKANQKVRSLRPYNLPPDPSAAGRGALVDQALAWRGSNEIVLVFRVQNVVMALAETGQRPVDLGLFAARLLGSVPTWLHTQGTTILNGADEPVRFAALNWYGAEQQDFVVGGLDYRPYEEILQAVKDLGYNAVRLPFSNQLVEQNPVVTQHLRANPELSGLHALDIMDRIIAYAGAVGLTVILDDHRSDAGWSSEENGLWYTPAYPDSAFDQDWATMAGRYAASNVVVGADLRNEPHGKASWGDGNPDTDWRAAAQRAGNAVLAANPHLLVIVEGVQYFGNAPSYWWGGNLMGVATAPVSLQNADGSPATGHLVYSAHDYGPDNCGGGCSWFNEQTTEQSLDQIWEQYWGYLGDNPDAPYAAPVWVGEFGTCNYNQSCIADVTPGSQGQWFSALLHFISDKNLGWAYWSANGTQSTAGTRVYGNLDWYGLFGTDWRTIYPGLDGALRLIRSDRPDVGSGPGH